VAHHHHHSAAPVVTEAPVEPADSVETAAKAVEVQEKRPDYSQVRNIKLRRKHLLLHNPIYHRESRYNRHLRQLPPPHRKLHSKAFPKDP
jgi:hypothetical protein